MLEFIVFREIITIGLRPKYFQQMMRVSWKHFRLKRIKPICFLGHKEFNTEESAKLPSKIGKKNPFWVVE
jgi:hypothetical protein